MNIETNRLIIKKLCLNMAKDIHLNSLDEDTGKFLPDEVFETVSKAKEVIKFLIKQYDNNNGPFVYAITLKNNVNIGYVQLVKVEDYWEIGYHVAKPYVNNGYASEAVNAFLPFIMNKLNVNTVYGITLKENVASVKVLQKCGFVKIFDGFGIYLGRKQEILKFVFTLNNK